MTQYSHAGDFILPSKLADRRAAANDGALPYMTEEGMVMIDRREPANRRVAAMDGEAGSSELRKCLIS